MQNGHFVPTDDDTCGSNPLLALVQASEAEVVLFNADEKRPDAIWDALWLQFAHRTPACASDESAFVTLAFVARGSQACLPNELTGASCSSSSTTRIGGSAMPDQAWRSKKGRGLYMRPSARSLRPC